MSIDRRISAQSRRRRVLYQTSRDVTPETAAERRTAERLREARRPTASYGSHVNRRLRGRWFSLVPVGRTAMSICGLVIFGSAMALTLLHWASVAWEPLANNVELARPLRLDRTDSFGSWAKSFYLAAASATALLVYQLRRYKVDDYTGSYRIWRSVIVLIAVLSIDSICNLVPWIGAMIDAVLGKRVALSGADWIRIGLTIGGGALALRLVAEVRRSRVALAMMLVALIGFAIPLLSHWNLVDTTSISGWMMTTSSPLLAAAALWISIGGYLRMLFREVRGFDEEELALQLELADARKTPKTEVEAENTMSLRRWFRRTESAKETSEVKTKKPRVAVTAKTTAPATEAKTESRSEAKTETKAETKSDAKVAAKPETKTDSKRSWFSFGRSKKPTDGSATDVDKKSAMSATKSPEAQKYAAAEKPVSEKPVVEPKPERKMETKSDTVDGDAKPKRSWFSLRRSKPTESKAAGTTDSPASTKPAVVAVKTEPATPAAAAPEKPARKGIGSWLRRDPAPKDAAATANDKPTPVPKPAARAESAESDDDDEDDMSDDSVDWGSMNKSERRRMRKEIKRGGRAA